jgi:PAS domain S-box-containing protein
MHEGAATLMADTTIIYCNSRFAELVARPAEQIIGARFSQFIDEKEKSAFTRLFKVGMAEKSSGEITFLSPENEVRYFNLSFSPLPPEDTGDVCIIVSDFTERKQAEELRISEEKYKAIFEQSGVGKSMTSISDGKMKMNKAFCQMLGYSEAELQALKWQQITPPDDLERDENIVNSLISGEKETIRWEKRYIHKNGSMVWVDISTTVQRDKEKNPLFFNTSIIDITQRKLLEQELLEAEWKFRALFDNGPIGVAYHELIYDRAGNPIDYRFIDVNSQYIELTGVDPKGKTIKQVFPDIGNDPFDWIGTYAQVVRTGKSLNFEQYFKPNDRWYNCVAFPYKTDQFVVAFFEITKRKRAEADLQKKMDELLLFQRLTVNRELKMIELKKEVNELLKGSGKDEKYRIVE